jgi:ATP-dependent Clp protease ATP-binding subunit ClpB
MTQLQLPDRETAQLPSWPQWISEIRRSLTARSQFVLAGNIRDIYLTPCEDGVSLSPIIPCLWEALKAEGYEFLLVYDMVDSLRVYPNERSALQAAERVSSLKLKKGYRVISRQDLPGCIRQLVGVPSECPEEEIIADIPRMAVVIDYASRLTSEPQSLSESLQEFFTGFEKFSHTANPRLSNRGIAQYNPVIWIVDQTGDLPDWFLIGNDSIRSLAIPAPDFSTRHQAASQLAPMFFDYEDCTPEQREICAETFAELTDNMSVKSMMSVTQIASSHPQIPLSNIGDAVRCFKIGIPDNPWKKDYMREQISKAKSKIDARVKGQSEAVIKTLDILKRSVMSLTGAHVLGSRNRPRGTLFFAGPTGVGKTELAKTIAQVLFGDEEAYIRFDMSEFASEHSDQRLIGAPPGYVGYDTGGELTNAIKQRPFSVVLFDEIEKGHPRILDKFLQILEDGRLTDGRGDTVYFSEAVIIFTSNLGVFVPSDDSQGHSTKRVQNVYPGMAYEEVKSKINAAIQDYFRFELNRPEILNRIGDNIVIFNFIEPKFAEEIFEKMLDNVLNRVLEEHEVTLKISALARSQLQEWCLKDLSNGGRGIGNILETQFINPLARSLFERKLVSGEELTIERIESFSDRCEVQFL